MDSCRDGWNVRNGSNELKILHPVSERVDCVSSIVNEVIKTISIFLRKAK